jgi:glycosyltransferase involved in cell wall biosynthesis
MRIVVVSSFYSEGMGYTENCLPKSLAALGHDVHVVTSNLNVYGNSADYDRTYRSFLGPADQGLTTFQVDGYEVHRLPSRLVAGYVWITGLTKKIREFRPEIVHSTGMASLQSFLLAAVKPILGFKLFAETHQHMSVVKPYLRHPRGFPVKRLTYRLTRTLPTRLASLAVERCYAAAPDCVDVATKLYGVPPAKIKLQPLGTDTDLFSPASSAAEVALRRERRQELGYADTDIVCIYTGRLSVDKNPLALAQAVAALSMRDARYHALFIGEGSQKEVIKAHHHARVLPFMRYRELPGMYRIADIAVWPTQESMSMLDAAASELPLVVSDAIGEPERVTGNGKFYREGDVLDLERTLASLASNADRKTLGAYGRRKMMMKFSWKAIARSIELDYLAAGVGAGTGR